MSEEEYRFARPCRIVIWVFCEEGDSCICSYSPAGHYFYPRPPRGGRQVTLNELVVYDEISIHALREEGDVDDRHLFRVKVPFLSTPSARRATFTRSGALPLKGHFYPRPPRGGRLCRSSAGRKQHHVHFYPRPPRGGRRCVQLTQRFIQHFYPRPPRGGRHADTDRRNRHIRISIHALREEGDTRNGTMN